MNEQAVAEVKTEDITNEIFVAWDKVVGFVNKILDAHVKFGFKKIEANLNPSLSDIIHGLAFADFMLGEFINSNQLEWDEFRMAINSRQCILHMQLMAAALESGDERKYEHAIRCLKTQPQF